MNSLRFVSSIATVVLFLMSILFVMEPASAFQAPSPPPSPPFTLTDPAMNLVSYRVEVSNSGDSTVSFRADLALPGNRAPDTFVEIVSIQQGEGETGAYSNRGNDYMYSLLTVAPHESTVINVTYHTLKYDLSVYTHNVVWNLSYPNDLTVYTQPDAFIESNDSSVQSVASAIIGSSTNPFRMAEKVYSFTISHLRYTSQAEIKGALWALNNGEGDCTEFSTLFVALMRSVGVPARTVTGYMSTALSLGGVANATQEWTDSPHMWAEFFVEGYGWVPVDPSSGENDPMNHFALSDSRYLPVMKGQVMESPYRSLLTVRSEQLSSLTLRATLLVTPQSAIQLSDQGTVAIYSASLQTGIMKTAAESAYSYDFGVGDSYGLIQEAYDSLHSALDLSDMDDPTNTSYLASLAEAKATEALESISTTVLGEARSAIDSAWVEMRTLGAISGERYLGEAEHRQSDGNYAGMVVYAYYAKKAADDSVNILLLVALVAFSGLVVWIVGRNSHSKGKIGRE